MSVRQRKPLRANPGKTQAWQHRSRRRAAARLREKPRSQIEAGTACFFAPFAPEIVCGGAMHRCHLVKEQFLRDIVGLDMEERWSQEYWVEGCGNHHRPFDDGEIHLERVDLPPAIERAADRHPKVAARLSRIYGPRAGLVERFGATA